MKALIILGLWSFLNTEIIKDDIKINCRIAVDVRQAKNQDSIVKSIRKKVLAINGRLNSLRKVTKDVPDRSAEGGELTAYFDGKLLVKAVLIYYGEMGKVINEYYFDQSELIFKYSTLVNYDKPMYLKDFKIKSKVEDRFYVEAGALIQWIKSTAVAVNKRSEEFKKEQLALTADLKDIKNILNEKH